MPTICCFLSRYSLICKASQGTTEYHRHLFPNGREKTGGRYVTVSGNIRKLDGTGHQIIMADGTSIPIDDIRFIEGSLFDAYEQY